MKRLCQAAALLLLVCGAAGACASARIEVRTVAQDEREVLRAVIRHMQTEDTVPAPAIVSLSMELIEEDAEEYFVSDAVDVMEEEGIRFPVSAIARVLPRNRVRASLAELVGDGTGARWITDAQMDSIQSATYRDMHAEMRLLEEMFPGAAGINWLSRPGFDRPRQHAAVAYGWACGPLCGTVGLYLLERRSDGWRVVHRLVTIVS